MKGNIYGKHLARVIRKRPLQPVLFFFILALSFLVIETGLLCGVSFNRDKRADYEAEYGKAQFSLRAADGGFIYAAPFSRALPDAALTGINEIPLLLGDELCQAVAGDFGSYGEIFSPVFPSAIVFPESRAASAVFLTRSFAAAHGLAVGDTLSLSLSGIPIPYTVYGISDEGFAGDHDILVDIRSVKSALLPEGMDLLLTDEFLPYSRLLVRTDGMSTEDFASRLYQISPDTAVSEVRYTPTPLTENPLLGMALLLVLLTVAAGAAVIYACTFCLAAERADDARLFSTAGMSGRMLFRRRVGEMLLYFALAVAVGTAFSYPLGRYLFGLLRFSHLPFRQSPGILAISAGALLVVALLPTFLFRARASSREKQRGERKHRPSPLWLFGGMALAVIALPLTPAAYRFLPGVAALGLFFAALGIFFPPLYRKTALCLSRRAKRIPFRVAEKHAARIDVLSNTGRLLSLLFTLLFTVYFLVGASNTSLSLLGTWLDADYMISGGDTTADTPFADEDVAAWCRIKEGTAWVDGIALKFWSVDDTDFFCAHTGVTEIPHDNEMILSRALAARYGFREGDEMSLRCSGGKYITVRVGKLLPSVDPYAFVNAEALGLDYDAYLCKLRPGADRDAAFSRLSLAAQADGRAVFSADKFLSGEVNKQTRYLVFAEFLAAFLTLFAAVGIADNLAESYRSRRDEIRLFSLCGMTRGQIIRTVLAECLYTLLFSLSLSLVAGVFAVFLCHESLLSFGVDVTRLFFTRV